MQNAEQGCWEFKPLSPLSKYQHFLIPTGKGKKKCLHSQGPNACSSFPCHQMPHYCITLPRDLTQEVFQQRVVTNSYNLNILNFESRREKIRNKFHTKNPQQQKALSVLPIY